MYQFPNSFISHISVHTGSIIHFNSKYSFHINAGIHKLPVTSNNENITCSASYVDGKLSKLFINHFSASL
ncbi:MAG: hypothetical protein Q8S84_07775 [bacterium]|nr:hypothetical protein [bacterium]MDP3381337.1 hypothetical protein [bacterium]